MYGRRGNRHGTPRPGRGPTVQRSDTEGRRWDGGAVRRIGLVAGPTFLLAAVLADPVAGLGGPALLTAGVAAWMATWWMTEAIPLPATSLLPLVLFPLLGLGTIGEATAPFANPVIFLFLGGFLIALAMEGSGLPRRIALRTILLAGGGPRAVVAGFMVAAAGLSMWVSNTATAVMMLPIGISVLDLVEEDGEEGAPRHLGVCLMLGIAYACSIGGMGTLIGTPPNAFLAGYLSEAHGVTVGFAEWMLLGVPLVAVGLPLAYAVLTRVAYPLPATSLSGGRDPIRRRLRELGPMSPAERRVLAVFGVTAAAWIGRPLVEEVVPGIGDATIAIAGALVLFLVPDGRRAGGRLLDWGRAGELPWGVLLLFGGGLSLASAFERSGLTGRIGDAAASFVHLPEVAVVAIVAATMVLLTELTSNTATAAALLPVFGSVAAGTGMAPLELAIPAALAASCAFMLPVATPPNAIVFGSDRVTIAQMAKAGLWLNLLFVVLITAFARWLGGPLLG